MGERLSSRSEDDSGNSEVEPRSPLSILVAEDDSGAAALLSATLQGHNVVMVVSAQDALEELRAASREGRNYDWVITDNGLMDSDHGGFIISEAIKSEGLGRPFVTMLTGSANEVRQSHSGDRLHQLGVDDLMGKPFRPSDLLRKEELVRAHIKNLPHT